MQIIIYAILTVVLGVFPYFYNAIARILNELAAESFRVDWLLLCLPLLIIFAVLLYCFTALPIKNRWVALGCHALIGVLYAAYLLFPMRQLPATYVIIIVGSGFCLAAVVGDIISLVRQRKHAKPIPEISEQPDSDTPDQTTI